MIRFIRSVRPRLSKRREAIVWAKEVASYLVQTYGLGPIDVYTERYGQTGTIHWMMDFRDMNALEEFSQAIQQDKAYLALVARGNTLLVDGSNYDQVLRLL